MNRQSALGIVLVALVVGTCLPAASNGIRSAGIRLILPFSGVPLSMGAEVITDVPFGGVSVSLFLSSRGGTLLLVGADIALTAGADTTNAYLRLSTGLSYFEPSRLLPSLLIGGGFSVQFIAADPFALGFASELLYPLAFPVPMITVAGAWMLP